MDDRPMPIPPNGGRYRYDPETGVLSEVPTSAPPADAAEDAPKPKPKERLK